MYLLSPIHKPEKKTIEFFTNENAFYISQNRIQPPGWNYKKQKRKWKILMFFFFKVANRKCEQPLDL